MSELRKVIIVMVMLAVLFGIASPVIMAQTTGKTLLQNLAAIPQFSNIAGLARAAGLDNLLNGANQYTLFAPTNDALAKIPADSLKALAGNRQLVSNLVNYHVVPGAISYSDLLNAKSITTADGRTIPVTVKNGVVSVGGAQIVSNGIASKNGVIYPINSVITPPGFTYPTPQVSRSTGFSWGWLPWLIGGLIIGGLAHYFLTRRHRVPDVYREGKYVREPRTRTTYEEPRAKSYESAVEEPRRTAEDTIRSVRESVGTIKEPSLTDITKNIDLPLSGDALKGLNMLLDNGTFKDKQDLLGFLAKSYMQNNLGSTIGSSGGLGVSTIMDIIGKSGIAKGFLEGDIKKYLVPLMMTGFMTIYHYLNRKPAVRTT